MGNKRKRNNQRRGKLSSHFLAYGGLAVVLAVYLFLAVLHSLIVPITQGEDELAHFRYISFIAETGRLPIDEAERQQAWYRADWPPLYHLLVGWAVSSLDTTQPHLKDVGESPRRRLVGEIFYPRLIIYTEDAHRPWQDGILAWHLGRFMSIGFSLIALVFTYLTALELCSSAPVPPRSPAPLLALAATSLLAFTPRFLFTSAMLSDDSLFILLSAIFIWLLLRALRGDDRRRLYAAMGLLLGLSITTKYSTGLLPLVIIPLVWWRARQASWGWRAAVGRLSVAWLFTLIGASWWFGWIGYYFNTIETDGLFFGLLSPILAAGPDVSMRRIFDFLGGGDFSGPIRPDAVAGGSFWEWWVYLFQTFWGVPVLENDPLFPWVYVIVLLFCLIALAGLWQFWQHAQPSMRMTVGLLALIVVLLFPFPILRYFLTFNILETGQGRHILFPAAQAIPILLVLGFSSFRFQILTFRSQESGVRSQGADSGKPHSKFYALRPTHYAIFHAIRNTQYALLLPLLLLTWSIFQLYHMHTTYPDPLPVQTTTFDPASIPQPLKHTFGEDIQFLGYDFQPDPDQAIINLTLFWKALNPVDQNFRTQVQLVDPDGEPRFTWVSHPLNGLYPTRAWDKGDVIRDTLPLPLAAVPAATYDIQLNLLPEVGDTPLTAEPLEFIQFDLAQRQPIPQAATLPNGLEYRLWAAPQPARQRQTIPLSWAGDSDRGEPPTWTLLGPDGVARSPVTTGEATAMFTIGGDWPSGEYRLELEDQDVKTVPFLTVANEARLFELPPELAAQPNWTPLEANFANQIELLGYAAPQRRLQPGGNLALTLAWQSLAPVQPDAVTFAVLLDADQQPYGSVDRYPAGYYSPMLWVEGEVIPDSFTVPIRADAPPGVYFLHLGLYDLVDDHPQSLPLFHQGQPTENTAVVIGPFKVGGPPPEVVVENPSPQVVLDQPLGEQITLLGYDLMEVEAHEPAVGFRFYWRAEVDVPVDYTTFLHLRNTAGENVAQKDALPAAGRYPSSLWETGEIIVDEIILPVDQVPPGDYTPVVGLYNFATGARLPVPGVPANEVALPALLLTDTP